MLIDAVKVFAEVGVKVALIVQAEPALSVPQLLVWAKLPLPAPVILMEEMVRVVFPLFVTVTVCGELVVPTAWFTNVRLAGERVAAGPWPVPVRSTCC
jgi:hypothetical protein